jgi:hypothetical protein
MKSVGLMFLLVTKSSFKLRVRIDPLDEIALRILLADVHRSILRVLVGLKLVLEVVVYGGDSLRDNLEEVH